MTRRALLGGFLMTTASASLANAPLSAPSPGARPTLWPPPRRPKARPETADLVAASGVTGDIGYILLNARSREVLEMDKGLLGLPPASVTKAVTAVYARDILGANYRYNTNVFADGTITDGVLDGTLILSGSGDPTLLTDDLAALAQSLADIGITRVTNGLEVWDQSLPYVNEIDPDQLDHFGYNPSLSGLNLNFNRVFFEWAREGGAYTVSLDARSETYKPVVSTATMSVVDRDLPIYTYADADGIDEWTVARRALGTRGSRWLPVRYPAKYAGDVFRTLCATKGIAIGDVRKRGTPPVGQHLATHQSGDMDSIVRACLKFSTNLTAEAIGLTATRSLFGPASDLSASAAHMSRWISGRSGVTVHLDDHSGLSDDSRISAAAMAGLLTAQGVEAGLKPLMKHIPFRDADGNRFESTTEVRAKTGTLNFVSTLAGYITTPTGDPLAFAIFAADMDKREASKASTDDIPAGAAHWNRKAKRLQQVLLQRWSRIYSVM